MLQQCSHKTFTIHSYNKAAKLRKHLTTTRFDCFIIVTTEQLPQTHALVTTIRSHDQTVPVLFVVSSVHQLPTLLSFQPFDCLLTPLTTVPFVAVIKRLLHFLNQSERYFRFNEHHVQQRLPLSDILYFEKNRRLVIIVTDSESYSTYLTTAAVKQQLDNQFVQIHRSYIINSRSVLTYNATTVTLKDAHHEKISLPLGRTFKQHALQQLRHQRF